MMMKSMERLFSCCIYPRVLFFSSGVYFHASCITRHDSAWVWAELFLKSFGFVGICWRSFSVGIPHFRTFAT
jgi:hypothetical protein